MDISKLRILNQDQVVRTGALDFGLAIEDVETAYKLHSSGKTVSKKASATFDEVKKWKMNSLISANDEFCCNKWLVANTENRKLGLPRSTSLIILNQKTTGLPLSLMDGTLISAVRTGACSAVAAKYLAKKNCRKIAVIGCGVISKNCMQALNEVIKNSSVMCYDVFEDYAKSFAEEMKRKTKFSITVAKTAEEASRDAEIVLTATTSVEPILKWKWLSKGSLYIHLGGIEDEAECALNSDKIVCDDWESIKHRNSQTIARLWHEGRLKDGRIHAEIGDVIMGKKQGRTSEDEIIYFNAVGLGELDQIIAQRVYRNAKREGVGTLVSLW
jgi:ornithine cyclodeaminase/alanine dehydrogenase-like protein (mu-crystallin family)